MTKPIRKLSAADEVFNYILDGINSGDFKEGHRFSTQDIMAEELGVSRSTIREAINKLTILGYLSAKPGVGTIVVNNSPTGSVNSFGQFIFLNSIDVKEFMEARLYLEKASIKLAVQRASPEDILKLNQMLIAQGQALAGNDSGLFSKLDSEFHKAIVEISKNKVLMKFLDIIWDGLSQFIDEVTSLQSAASHAFSFHTSIVRYLSERNLQMAERSLLLHLRDVAMNIEEHFTERKGLCRIFDNEYLELNNGEGPVN
jgi:GntR family transcriptional repressor for pyruvate dehydrogenase complex